MIRALIFLVNHKCTVAQTIFVPSVDLFLDWLFDRYHKIVDALTQYPKFLTGLKSFRSARFRGKLCWSKSTAGVCKPRTPCILTDLAKSSRVSSSRIWYSSKYFLRLMSAHSSYSACSLSFVYIITYSDCLLLTSKRSVPISDVCRWFLLIIKSLP